MNRVAYLVFLLALSGCVTFSYRSSDIESAARDADGQIENAHRQAKDAYQLRYNLYKALQASGAKMRQPPYDELTQNLKRAHQAFREFEAVRESYNKVKQPALLAIQGKDKVKSNDPSYGAVTDFRDKVPSIASDFKTKGEGLKEKIKAFDEVLQREKIAEVDVAAMKTHIDSEVARGTDEIAKVRKKIDDSRKELANRPPSDREAWERKFSSLEDGLKQIEAKLTEINSLVDSFKKEAGTKSKLVVGPHMVSHSIAVKLTEKFAEIKALISSLESMMKS